MIDMVLPEDFEISKYGIHARFVIEEDASFILSLRTDKRLNKHIHATANDLSLQQKWIKAYKERERRGEEYYLIYDIDGVPFGVNRIYDITSDSCTDGSWVCLPLRDASKAIATELVVRDIIFEVLGYKHERFEVRKQNRRVQQMHLMLGATQLGETEDELQYELLADDYFENRARFIDLFNLR